MGWDGPNGQLISRYFQENMLFVIEKDITILGNERGKQHTFILKKVHETSL